MLQTGTMLNEIHPKERMNTASFQLYEVTKVVKLVETEGTMVASGGSWEKWGCHSTDKKVLTLYVNKL